ncbi:hypothetical protein CTKZ_19840 [Cellulomonas algicola]|uniref:DUF885 domain-containing protein n=1 Tax=Cellulomonas algicola TaxID=2071633 RepID=A0A401V0J0_9CELL|nr:DUF885 domain-containing protein [Cellulomonas algicola]GCD20422.1 hypothetical protein CTKZ_19840 [Cellulomonas algicola]
MVPAQPPVPHPTDPTDSSVRTARQVADRWVDTLADLDPSVGTALGTRPDDRRMPDLSPAGARERAEAARAVLTELDGAPVLDDDDRRCATLLRERLTARLAEHDTGEDLAALRPIASPVQTLQSIFLLMPTATEHDWHVVAGRLAQVPDAADGFRATLEEGLRRGVRSAPRQADAVVGQLGEWIAAADGRGWHAGFADRADAVGVPTSLRGELDGAAQAAAAAVDRLRRWIADEYRPAVDDVPDAVGRERYLLSARLHTGADLDPQEAYAWGWEELARIEADMAEEADRVLPGAGPQEALAHLDEHGEAVEGVEEVRAWLQRMMDDAIAELDGTVVDVADPVRRVEAMIAPPGAAAAPYYTRPSLDFSRPGRTWLPTLGRDRFPTWDLISTWYHEGVPGHHLQLGQWAYRAGDLSVFQTSVGSVPATTEGWALYAERLMDELGHLRTPGARLGYLDGQRMRAVRVVVDIGMHLGLAVPGSHVFHPGERWTAGLGEEFFRQRSGSPAAFVHSEIERYLGWPGQAISYKLGERAWLSGRRRARERRAAAGETFDLRAWHTAALGLGSLGLDDLERELAAL